jgi:hypothetical protein
MQAHADVLPAAADRAAEGADVVLDKDSNIGAVIVASLWLALYVAAALHSLAFGG